MTDTTTPQETLTEALRTLDDMAETDRIWRVMGEGVLAERLLAALPDGWRLIGPQESAALADGEALAALPLAGGWDARLFLTGNRGRTYGCLLEHEDSAASYEGYGPTIAAAAEAALAALEARP